MKSILVTAFVMLFSQVYSQNSNCDVSLNILKKVFANYEIKQIEGQKVFETVVWENHASIPLTECHIVYLDDGITALAFDIYMSDVQEDYTNMRKEGITMELDISNESRYKGTGERLIQVIFYDTENNKFLGKPEGFPIAELLWIDQGYTSPLRTDKIKTFTKLEECTNTILLTIEEYDGYTQGLHYFFKYHNDKIMTKSLRTCIEKVYEQKNKLMVHHIENCLEVKNEDAVPENVFRILMKW